jgi:leucyl-tRNA synthetase
MFISHNVYQELESLPSGTQQAEFLKRYVDDHPMVKSLKQNFAVTFGRSRVDVNIVDGLELDVESFKKWRPEYANADFVFEPDNKYICGVEVEKMSKSKYNTVNPDILLNVRCRYFPHV